MLLHAFVSRSHANGPGRRCVIYFQGCSLGCRGCWNSNTHRFRGDETSTAEIVERVLHAWTAQRLDGITFSGGEPMQQAEALIELLQIIRGVIPGASFGMFTGYTEDEVNSGQYITHLKADLNRKRELWAAVRTHLDFAVMGRYDASRPAADPLRTSRNQQLRLFNSRYSESDFGPQLVEVTLQPDGHSLISGFPVRGQIL